jgi:hypothetical protein
MLCFLEILIVISSRECEETIRVNLNNISVCFIIFFSSNIKILIDLYLLHLFSSIFLNNKDKVSQNEDNNGLQFFILDPE